MSAGLAATPADVVHTWDVAEARGWALFPVHAVVNGHCTCGLRADKDHTSAGKHPRTRDGFKSATKNRVQWEDWARAYDGQLSWGLATGETSGNVLVIDVDGRHDGYRSLTELDTRVGGLPDTLRVRSGSGSPHYYFRLPPNVHVSSNNRFMTGIDLKSDGGYVVLPPASHTSGGYYSWDHLVEIADAPPALIEIVRESDNEKQMANGAIFGVPDADLLRGMSEGQRDELIFKSACRWFRVHNGDRAAVEVLVMYMAANCEPPFLDWRAKVDSAEKSWRRGETSEKPANDKTPDVPVERKVVLTKASTITIQPVKWLWEQRLALGAITLLGGREGIGKSTVAYDMVAQITRGRLVGCFYGQPKSVLICATEDSWSHTIIPRLMAANADLDRVFRVGVQVSRDSEVDISLPDDIDAVGDLALETNAAMLLLDPLLSRLDGKLDTHKDAEVRRALEPLARTADRCNVSVLGLIHVNKSSSADPLNLLMASRAFAAMARAVLFAMMDSEDEQLRHLGQAKNNLGRTDLPTLDYRIVSTVVAHTVEGPVETGKVEWTGESQRSIRDLLRDSGEAETVEKTGGSTIQEAMDWLQDYLTIAIAPLPSAQVKDAAKKAGISPATLGRAQKNLKVIVTSVGFPRVTSWSLFTGEQGLSA